MNTVIFEYLFWISCFLIAYNYAGYAVIVKIWNTLTQQKKPETEESFFPSLSFIVAAFNEADCIEKKILNSFELEYPSEKIEFIFITDGSTDDTPDIIRQYSSINVLHSPERKGKSAALNRAVKAAQNDILIFSDANTILNKEALVHIGQHYKNKNVGGVSGEKKVLVLQSSDDAGNSEGLYWKYESYLKKLDSDFYSVVGAAGELFSVRKALYEPVPQQVILDDFLISMQIAVKGFRIIYEPRAYAMELPSFSLLDEKKRKVRIAAGGFQAMAMLPQALHFWKHAKLSFLYISHRVMRWAVSPLCLLLALATNIYLLTFSNASTYKIAFIIQCIFYACGLLAHLSPILSKNVKILRLPYYFIFMNISVIQGFFRFLRRKQPSTWEKVKRSSPNVLNSQVSNP